MYEFVCVVQGHGRLEAYLLGVRICFFQYGQLRPKYLGKCMCVFLSVLSMS